MSRSLASFNFTVRTVLTGVALLAGASVGAQTGSGGKDGTIEKCERNLGTLAVAEPQSHMLSSLSQYQLGSPATMLRMIAHESGCFSVVERGVAMQNIQQERALAAGGMLQQDANMGGGQLQAADFVLTPSLQFADNTGGVSSTVTGLLGRYGGPLSALSGLAGGVKFKEAETTLLLADVRSGIQVASAEGQASKMDFSLGGWGWGGYGWASAGGYSKTPEGKLLAASLLDNFNRIVQQVRNKPALVKVTSTSSQANAHASTRATPLAPPAPPPVAVVVQQPMALAGLPTAVPAQAAMQKSGTQAESASKRFDKKMYDARGNYAAEFSGQLSGTITLMVDGEGRVVLMATPKGQSVLMLSGEFSNSNGDFAAGGATALGAMMFSGKLDLNAYTVQGKWYMVKSESGVPELGGTFQGKR